MPRHVVRRIKDSLTEKRENLSAWREAAPAAEKEICLGCATEADLQTHLEVIDATLEEVESETFGICQVCHEAVDTSLLEMDYTATICLGCLSAEEQTQLETDLELSQTVQRALMPQQAPAIPGLDVAAFSRPAQIVGGDYFDFIPLEDGTYVLTIADAMGHGLSAGMFMTGLQATLHTLLPESQSPSRVLERINHFYLHNIHYTTFVTVFLGKFDPATRSLTYFNAGHNPPALVRRSSGEVTWLRPNGAAIGIVEEYQIQPGLAQLQADDVLVLYTDGVTEAINTGQEQFGVDRLGALLLQYAGLSAVDMISMLRQELGNYTDGRPPADDTTIVVCKLMQ
jgi:phosphoserine phosphatase RsbU/P